MDPKLARGHAATFVRNLQDHKKIAAWCDSRKGIKARDVFDLSSRSKKPGRVLKRLRPLLAPVFHKPTIVNWSKHHKQVVATALSQSSENSIFQLPEQATPLYDERAVFLSEATLITDDFNLSYGTQPVASMSLHAMTRLLEREGATPDTLALTVVLILTVAANLADIAWNLDIGLDEMQSFLIPGIHGAFVAVTMDMDPTCGGEDRMRILSIRTYLDEDKLSVDDHERMAGVSPEILSALSDADDGDRIFDLWVKGNARPWTFADTTLENAARRGAQANAANTHDSTPEPTWTSLPPGNGPNRTWVPKRP